MNSVNSVFENFDFLSDNAKTNVHLYGDPRLDGESNKFILEGIKRYQKETSTLDLKLFKLFNLLPELINE